MLSLSDNEFAVINYLVRDFSSRDTIRSIAKRLGFSPAGVYNILKKLEQQHIVYGEKLGTGLFYKINLESRVAKYLALAVLAGFYEHSIDLEKYRQSSKAAFFDRKNVLFVVDNMGIASDFSIEGVNIIVKNVDEFIELLRKKDSLIMDILRKGNVMFGEEFVLDIIKKFVERF